MFGLLIDPPEGGEEIYGGSGEVHYEMGDCSRDCEGFGWWGRFSWGRSIARRSFCWKGYYVLLCGGQVEEFVRGPRDKFMAIFIEWADKIFDLNSLLVMVFLLPHEAKIEN